MTILYRPNLLARLSCLITTLAALSAQCVPLWLSGNPAGGPAGNVSALLALPGGELLAGGTFRVADAAEVRNLARWDGSTWRAFGAGTDAEITCLARLPNGDLVAGGRFTTMDGVPCARIARFDGAAWSALGAGFDGDVLALLVLPNGELIAGGSFGVSGGTVVPRIAQWNGSGWATLGGGFGSGSVHALARRSNGDVVAAGPFLGQTASGVLRWDGTAWLQLNGFDSTSLADVRSLAALPNGSLALGGTFALGGVTRSVAVWDGSGMQPVGSPLAITSPRVLVATNGDLVAAGSAAAGGAGVARWNGSQWTTFAGGPQSALAVVELASGDLAVGARTDLTGVRNHAVVQFDGFAWQSLGAPLPPVVRDVVRLANDDVVVGGSFTTFAGIAANRLARFDGAAWAPLGTGVDGEVQALAGGPNGDLIVTGVFQSAGGAPANHIARFDGANWSTLGAGIPAAATALAVAPDGAIAALDGSTLRMFDGLQWTSMQVPGLVGGGSLIFLDANRLAIGGLFLSGPLPVGGLTVLQNGTFTVVPGAPLGITNLLLESSGDLLVASGSGVRRWASGTWSIEFAGNVTALAQLPNGDLVAGGVPQILPGAMAPTALWRRTPAGWREFGAIDGGGVRRVVVTDRGETFAAGAFTLADGSVSSGFAVARASCAATVQSFGAGCSGGAGPVTLTSQRRAWIGGTLRTIAAGLTANSLAVQAIGLSATLLPLPGGASGCSIYVSPLATDLLLPVGGLVVAEVDVPRDPALVGLALRLQVVGVELDPLGIVRLTSTNALDCTVGSL